MVAPWSVVAFHERRRRRAQKANRLLRFCTETEIQFQPHASSHTQAWPTCRSNNSGRREVKSALCVSTDRPTIMKFRVSDSAHPTDRPAARSAAKQILGRNTRPTDPLGPRQSRSGATFGHFRGFPPPCGSERPTDRPESDQLRPVGSSDRPTHSEAVLIRRVHF